MSSLGSRFRGNDEIGAGMTRESESEGGEEHDHVS